MPTNPSFYFTLFKKFQVLNHVPSSSVHGSPGSPTGGFNLRDPAAANGVFGGSNSGSPLTAGDSTPANSPLWYILNERATGTNGLVLVTIPSGAQAGSQWPVMPPGLPPAWNEFQVTAAAPKLVDVFGTWITNGQTKDIPTSVIAAQPPQPIAGALDPGVSLFVCSYPTDNGVRPGGVPADYWATSLIFLMDPQTGNTVTPATLNASADYYLVAVIGNRGNSSAGRYLNHPPAIEVAASVMVWNTFDSPGVELPSLSNLDATSTNGIYEQYFLRSGEYDIGGWHLNVQTVFNGIIAALTDAVNNHGLNLGGLTPTEWVLSQPAHLCSKVVIRGETAGQAFPNFGTDTPDVNRRIAQKNLAPFEAGITTTDPNPNIIWKNFIVGQPLFLLLKPGDGGNKLVVKHNLPAGATQVFIAIPARTFEAYGLAKALAGFKVVPADKLPPTGPYKGKPFPDAVILRQVSADASINVRLLQEKEYLGMAIGVEYDMKKVKHGPLGEISVAQHSAVHVQKAGTRCFDLVEKVVGGFTLQVRATDPHVGPKGRVEFPEAFNG